MQIFAFDKKEFLISALRAERKKDYICPECKGVVRARGGHFKRAHFYHIQSSISCRLGKKTLQHLTIQLYFEKILPTCALEVPFPSIKRIADCVWEPKKIIFEIQCSHISSEEIKKRIFDYSSLGYKVVWILHDKTFNQSRATQAEAYLQNIPHYYTNINLDGIGSIYDQFAYIKNRLFIEKTAPFPIDPTTVQSPFKSSFLHRKSWDISFKGDLLQDPSKINLKAPTFKKISYSSLLIKFWGHILKKVCT